MLESELEDHLGYDNYERSQNSNSRNGKKEKLIRSSHGEFPISVPQDWIWFKIKNYFPFLFYIFQKYDKIKAERKEV